MIEIAPGSTVYVDTNVFIYFVEKTPPYFDAVESFFRFAAGNSTTLTTSELTIAECLYKPCKLNDTTLRSLYEKILNSDDIALYPLTGDVAIRAAEAGGSLGLKLIDAIHYMSALEAGCDVFVTADRRFKSTQMMDVVCI